MLAMILLLAAAPDPEAVRQAIVAKCAIAPDRLAIEHWNDSPEDVLVVKGEALLPVSQFDCLGTILAEANTQGDPVAFSFEDASLGKRQTILGGRDALARMGLLERLPVFDPEHEMLARFGRRLERLCNVRPGSLLIVRDGNLRVRDHVFEDEELLGGDDVVCVINALEASGFNALGMPEPVYVPVTIITAPAS